MTSTSSASSEPPITIRHTVRPGDLGRVATLHGVVYAAEYGLDIGFEAYVAHSLGEWRQATGAGRDRLWLAERDDRLVGSIGIIGREADAAQLRWFLVDRQARGQGLGQRLLADALAFCRAAGYRAVFLWTVDSLVAAARLYTAAGFRKTEDKPRQPMWGALLAEQRYDLDLADPLS